MSKIWNDVVQMPGRDVVEAHMRRARIERSRAMWSMLSGLFSRPESSKEASGTTRDHNDAVSANRA